MVGLKKIRKFEFLSTPVKLLSHFKTDSTDIEVLSTDILTLNPSLSNSKGFNGSGHYNSISL